MRGFPRREIIWLLCVIAFAAFLRLYQLDNIPPGLHADEALTGYTAYSLIKTGLDLHAKFNFFNLSDTNIGGTYPPLFTYVLIPFISSFGPTIFILRLPSAIAGILTVLISFFIVKKLFKSFSIAILTSFLIAANPWSIHISRQGLLEALSLLLVVSGIFFFLHEKRLIFVVLSAVFFGLSLFAYDASRLFLPPFLVLIGLFRKKELVSAKKNLFVFLCVFSIFYLLVIWSIFFRGEIQEYERSSIINISKIASTVDQERYLTNAPLWLSSLFHNKITVALKHIQTSYFDIFSINWFFVNGSGNLQHAVGRHGAFYLFELPFFFIGIYVLFRKNIKLAVFFLVWIALGVLPAGLSTGNYVYRAIHVLPAPMLFSSVGMIWLWNWSTQLKKGITFIIRLTVVCVITIYTLSYLFTYFFDYPVYASSWWGKQQNDAIRFAAKKRNEYKNIFIDGGEQWMTTYSFLSMTDPAIQQHAYKNQLVFNGKKVMKMGNVYFGDFDLHNVSTPSAYFPSKSLVITSGENFKEIDPIYKFFDPGGVHIIFKAIEIK